MSRVRVKICGIGTLDDALAAIDYGADALGFNFWPRSPRYITPSAAGEIIERLPPFVSNIGVFVNESAEQVTRIACELSLAAVQLHGDESPEFCARLAPLKSIKALRVGTDFDCEIIKSYPANMILLDARSGISYGGTGETFDWSLVAGAREYAPIILAGGLTADNVAEAVSVVRPAAIDACSGVEAEPGRKDLRKLREFMAAVERL